MEVPFMIATFGFYVVLGVGKIVLANAYAIKFVYWDYAKG
jgi:hypothetical protein